jgi:hypothetical protein
MRVLRAAFKIEAAYCAAPATRSGTSRLSFEWHKGETQNTKKKVAHRSGLVAFVLIVL